MGLFNRSVTPSQPVKIEIQAGGLSTTWVFAVSGQKERTIKSQMAEGIAPGDIASRLEAESTVEQSGVFLIRSQTFDGKGLQHGPYKRCYPNGTIKEEGAYDHGVPHGSFKTYHKSGRLAESGEHVNGTPVGTYERYYANGLPAVIRNRDEDGKLHGEYKTYNLNGTLAWDLCYAHGEPTGSWKWYNENGGLIKQQSHDENGNIHGTVERFFDDGSLKERKTYHHGEVVLSPDDFHCERETKLGYSHQSKAIVANENGAGKIQFGYEEPGL
jgi:antitoxin component YwqK of YwqJK toxin-antitoxin module